MTPQEIRDEAQKLSDASMDSSCWKMDPICSFFHEALMNGDVGTEEIETDAGSSVLFAFDRDEAEAFFLGSEDSATHIALHYSSNGGAPDYDLCSIEEWDAFRAARSIEEEEGR